ncbi:MAG: response regulator [Shimia sp.]
MGLNVLAVDDSRTMRRQIAQTLEEAGIEAHLADDGVHGLEVLQGIAPDAIITDINMPNMDGFGFIDEVRKQAKHDNIPILVLTTESAPELRKRARLAGATGWIVKPFDPVRLVRALKMIAG